MTNKEAILLTETLINYFFDSKYKAPCVDDSHPECLMCKLESIREYLCEASDGFEASDVQDTI
jgi:hypothetical protein